MPPNGENFYPRPPRGGRRRPSCHRHVRLRHFYPRPPRGGRPRRASAIDPKRRISIHALREEGDQRRLTVLIEVKYFYPRPPRGGRRAGLGLGQPVVGVFLSTPSARRATQRRLTVLIEVKYFYPRPPRGGRRGHPDTSGADRKFLSTPSARRATAGYQFKLPERNFYPRPPRGGRPLEKQ